jgi:hypothetical protein
MLRKLLGLGSAAALALGLAVPPAHAASAAAAFVGTANVNPGLWFPGANPAGATTPVTAAWAFASTTSVPVSVSGNGSVTGFCGQSTGSGTAHIGAETLAISWVSAGGTLILTGISPRTGAAIVQARPLPSTDGQVPCLTEPAVNFTVAGVGAVV